MKKSSLIFLALLLSLGACSQGSPKQKERKTVDFDTLESNDYETPSQNIEEISTFHLLSPYNGAVLEELTTFTWEEATNAERYTFEICSSHNFINDNPAIDYYIQNNIDGHSWTPNVILALKNTNYYWRVTAYNGRNIPYTSETFSFFIEAPEIEEFKFDLGEADDWQLHPTGSYADIAIDNTNFFGKGEDKSVVVSFKKEDTMQGKPESDGWIIVTKTIEKSIYGTDAVYFDLYYSGQDAEIFIRLIDRDNEFWFCPVQVSNNAKQSVILKFSDFVQRTKDVTVGNRTFDYERIKYLEIVFEKSFGDGMLLFSNCKAIKFSNYSNFFIDKLNFLDYEESQWINDSYEFERDVTEDELTIKYWGDNSIGKPSIRSVGYGFVKIAVGQYFDSGDSIKVKFKYTGSQGTSLVIRIYEEDKDRWFYRVPFSSLTEGEYKELIIPFAAFDASSIEADGKRQFYYIINLQFGVEGEYGTGTASFKDFEIVDKKDYATEEKRVVDGTGMIENFDNYEYSTQMYMIWELSTANKEEYISLNKINKFGGSYNPYCGQFEYKADMEPATYELPIQTDQTFESFNLLLKDDSIHDSDPHVDYLDSVNADMTIYIELVDGEIYSYHFEAVKKAWYQYYIPFSSFELTNRDFLPFVPSPITGSGIIRIAFTLQYFYYDYIGNPYPLYTNDNKVYMDNISFGHESVYQEILKEKIIHMDDTIALVDDFESYQTDLDVNDYWVNDSTATYQKITLSNDVSSEGGSHSVALQFKEKSDSPKYYIAPAIDSGVKGRAIKLSMRCDIPLKTFYLNLYFKTSNGTVQYRCTLTNLNTEWTEYTIGISNDNFALQGTATPVTLNANMVKNISRISFGMTHFDGSTYNLKLLYIDNIYFDYDSTIPYDTNSRRVIDEE